LVPPDTEHDLRTECSAVMLRSMATIDRASVVFFLLRVVIKYPLFISSHNSMQKTFSLLFLNQLFASEKSPSNISRFQFTRHLISLFLNHSHSSQSYRNDLLSYLHDSASLAFDLLRVMPLILCLRIFLAVQSEACLQRWNLHPWNVEIIPYIIYHNWSSVTINFDKHSMGFSRTFLSIKAENQNLPQMLLD